MDNRIISQIYRLYGYKIINSYDNVIVCLYEEGRYFGADIIPLKSDRITKGLVESIRYDYSNIGYATNIKEYSSIEDVELELYKSFFSYKISKKRVERKYIDFKKKQERLNGGYRYEYINSPYVVNGEINGNHSITSSIASHLKVSRPQLIIIEAAAGYGKTCTSYELLKDFISSSSCEIPLLTELSRNRGANIFRYILLDEIDREYPNLDSRIVKHEIQTGRIPLIIDGFDELLKKSDIVTSDKGEVFREVETMLDTIGKLLVNNAKVVLTTRKTAIFSGNDFINWTKKWKDKFDISRYSISVPKIKNWIGENRFLDFKNNNIPVEYIANPVLLTYLRNLSNIDFYNILVSPEEIVTTYFSSLLEREKNRQDLRISAEQQYQIFKRIVKMLVEFDISTEKQSFFKELIYDQNRALLDETLKLYPSNVDIDDLLNKLSNHALLDRKGSQDQIGFINDFVFGTFVGELMSEMNTNDINSKWSSYMVETGVTAYRVQNVLNKKKLWEKINALSHRFEQHSLFNFDITLKNSLQRNYHSEVFDTVNIFNIEFSKEFQISKSLFSNCLFKNCLFKIASFENVTFLNCKFEDCSINNKLKLEDFNNVIAINCVQSNSDVLLFHKTFEKEKDSLVELENLVLKEIFTSKDNKINSILRTIQKNDRKLISQVFSSLLRMDYIDIVGLKVYLKTNKIHEIKKRIRK